MLQTVLEDKLHYEKWRLTSSMIQLINATQPILPAPFSSAHGRHASRFVFPTLSFFLMGRSPDQPSLLAWEMVLLNVLKWLAQCKQLAQTLMRLFSLCQSLRTRDDDVPESF